MILKQTRSYTIYKYNYANKSAVAPESTYLCFWVTGHMAQHAQFSKEATDEAMLAVMEQNIKEYLDGE